MRRQGDKEMKKIIAFILSLALATTLCATLASCNDSTSTDKTVSYKWDITEADGEVTLNAYTVSDYAKELIADKDYAKLAEGFGVPEKDVKTITIPENVTKIAANAIDSLSFIEELVVGENVKTIEQGAFSNLSSLKKITIPFVGSECGAPDATNNMTGSANANKLFGYIFGTASSSSLTSCTQTYNDGDSGNTATYYIPTTLETVVVTGKIQSAEKEIKVVINDDGNYVLPKENDERETVTITVKSYSDCAVQPYAFYGITTIKNVYLNGGEVFANTFNGCTALENVYIESEDKTVKIGKNAFNGCTSLKNVTVDANSSFKGVTVIGESAFAGCTALGVSDEFTLGELILPDAKEIDTLAFDKCTGIVRLVLNADAALDGTTIKEKAFNGCTGLIEVKKGTDVIIDADHKMVEKSDLAKIFSSCSDDLYEKKTAEETPAETPSENPEETPAE